MIGGEFGRRLSAKPSLDTVLKFACFLGSLAIVLAAPVLWALAFRGNDHRPWSSRSIWIWSGLGTAAVFFIFTRGRADWVHLSFYFPLLLFFAASAVNWDTRGRASKTWAVLVLVCLGASAARWVAVWIRHPPMFERVLKADALLMKDGPLSWMNGIRNDDGTLPPALLLPQGSLLYFYWAPDPPPVALLMPPSWRVNGASEYEALATFAESRKIPFILIEKRYAQPFVAEPSALSGLLHSRYKPFKEWPTVVVFRRVEDAAAAN
jgi:hypothetical protein